MTETSLINKSVPLIIVGYNKGAALKSGKTALTRRVNDALNALKMGLSGEAILRLTCKYSLT